MARDETPARISAALARPAISLIGEVDEQMVDLVVGRLRELDETDPQSDLAIELTTLGGDAEMARRIALEFQLARARRRGRLAFLGKTAVYSAGTTIMSAFPRADRYLTSDAMVMIHCRQLDKTVEISGPLRGSLPQVEALRHQIETGIAIEEDNFSRLIDGSDIALEELFERALANWYLPAAEAQRRGLVAAVVDLSELRPAPPSGTEARSTQA